MEYIANTRDSFLISLAVIGVTDNDNFLTYQISQDDGSDAYYGTQDLKIIGLVVHAVIEQPVPNSKNGKKGLPTL